MSNGREVEIDGKKLVEHDLICPECSGPMKLGKGRFGIGYSCAQGWEKCKGSHGAHPDGAPMGTPANWRTRKLRSEAHEMFDRLWRKDAKGSSKMSRSDAYAWMRSALGLDSDSGHISKFDSAQCRKLMAQFEKDFPELCLDIEPIG